MIFNKITRVIISTKQEITAPLMSFNKDTSQPVPTSCMHIPLHQLQMQTCPIPFYMFKIFRNNFYYDPHVKLRDTFSKKKRD